MKVLVVAPHPDDEVLGVAGTLLRRKAEGCDLAWVIVTGISIEHGWDVVKVQQRESEITQVSEMIGFDKVFRLNFPTTLLNQTSMPDLITALSDIFKTFEPEEIFVPHYSDIHTDHRIVFDAVAACSKWFRYPSIGKILAYETLSETDFSLAVTGRFQANYFVNISSYLDEKIKIMSVYASEMGAFPFPRSAEALRALAALRGVASGYEAAEAFELLKERS